MPGLALAAFSAYFFRDPERHPPAGAGVVVAPADGRVVKVHDGPLGPHVAIFLSVLDVHINRSPIAGRVERVRYREGRFLAAYDERAGDANERNDIVVAGPAGPVEVSQIAGVLARRIVCSVRAGDHLALGQRLGLIRFGSRTDLRLPPRSTVEVVLGQRVRGGETIVGHLPAPRAGEQRRVDAMGEVTEASAGPRGSR
jgi:phosphatidylserine decarboxylase